MQSRKVITALIVVAASAAALAIGLFWGKLQGEKEGAARVEGELRPLVDRAFPPPPPEIANFGGTIKDIYGAKITLEIIDPDDYLPHADGTPQRRENRYVLVSADTKITLVDYAKRDAAGVSPLISSLKLSDLKVDDVVSVRSDKNIRDLQEFDATTIELVKY